MSRVVAYVEPVVDGLGRIIFNIFQGLGDWSLFAWESFKWLTHRPVRLRLFFQQMEFVGVKSTPIIVLTGIFVGAVFALQTGKAFALFNAESLVGATIGLTLTREIGPVFTALMVTARACSAMAAELGTMRVTEQIDAMETMAVDPVHYLVVPRVVAATLMTPLLTGIFVFMGIVGGWLVGVKLLGIDEGSFFNKLYYYVVVNDLLGGLVKAAFFGCAISLVSCYQGFYTRNGAEGVGRATTQAVVISSVVVLVMDYFLTSWILHVFKSSHV